MKHKNILLIPAILLLMACNDSKSYNELLDEEDKAVNSFLANQRLSWKFLPIQYLKPEKTHRTTDLMKKAMSICK